ncbi:MAG: hypothetical protein WBV94_18600 [Blastocatellia bacterium]
MNLHRLDRNKVNELRRLAFNGDTDKEADPQTALLTLCDAWLRKESEVRRLTRKQREFIDLYEGVLKRRHELLKRLLYEALRKVEEGLPQESGGVRAGQLSVGATRIYDSVLSEIKKQL